MGAKPKLADPRFSLKTVILRSAATKNLVLRAQRFFAPLGMTDARRHLGQSPDTLDQHRRPVSDSAGASRASSSDTTRGHSNDPQDAPLASARKLQGRAITSGVVLLALVGVVVLLLDWREVREVLGRAEWEWMPLTLLFTTFSYYCLSHSFALINDSFGIGMSRRDLLSVGFVSSAMIAAVGGLAGHAIRVLLMAKRGLAASDVMAPSLFHGYIESLAFFALIPAGLIYLLLTHPLSSGVALWLSVGTGILGVAFAITAVVFFYGPARSVALWVVGAFIRLVIRRDISAALRKFESTLNRGLEEVRRRPRSLLLPVTLILADRAARVGVIWFCFQALGSDVAFGVTVTGFAIGVAAGVMSMVPGGIGVQEGSIVGTYHLLGVPLEEAVLASILFRAVYYMVPFGVSLGFYRSLMRREAWAPA